MKLSSEIMVDDGIGKNGKRGHKDREDCGKGGKSCMSRRRTVKGILRW